MVFEILKRKMRLNGYRCSLMDNGFRPPVNEFPESKIR